MYLDLEVDVSLQRLNGSGFLNAKSGFFKITDLTSTYSCLIACSHLGRY